MSLCLRTGITATLAPGGNDDGSGTTMLLALARHLGQHKIEFEREVRLVAFSGEEQGLVGSQVSPCVCIFSPERN